MIGQYGMFTKKPAKGPTPDDFGEVPRRQLLLIRGLKGPLRVPLQMNGVRKGNDGLRQLLRRWSPVGSTVAREGIRKAIGAKMASPNVKDGLPAGQ